MIRLLQPVLYRCVMLATTTLLLVALGRASPLAQEAAQPSDLSAEPALRALLEETLASEAAYTTERRKVVCVYDRRIFTYRHVIQTQRSEPEVYLGGDPNTGEPRNPGMPEAHVDYDIWTDPLFRRILQGHIQRAEENVAANRRTVMLYISPAPYVKATNPFEAVTQVMGARIRIDLERKLFTMIEIQPVREAEFGRQYLYPAPNPRTATPWGVALFEYQAQIKEGIQIPTVWERSAYEPVPQSSHAEARWTEHLQREFTQLRSCRRLHVDSRIITP